MVKLALLLVNENKKILLKMVENNPSTICYECGEGVMFTDSLYSKCFRNGIIVTDIQWLSDVKIDKTSYYFYIGKCRSSQLPDGWKLYSLNELHNILSHQSIEFQIIKSYMEETC